MNENQKRFARHVSSAIHGMDNSGIEVFETELNLDSGTIWVRGFIDGVEFDTDLAIQGVNLIDE